MKDRDLPAGTDRPIRAQERPRVSFGAQYMGGDYSLKDFCVAIESAGLDSVWSGDHLEGHLDGLTALGIMAGATSTIAIGTNVLVAPLRHPVVAAKGVLTAASVAPGRVIVGVGPGGDVPRDFDAVGAVLQTRGAYTNEAIEVMRRLWEEAGVDFNGEWTTLSNFTMLPRGLPVPPVWVGGRSTAAIRRAAAYGQGYMPYLVSPEQLRQKYALLLSVVADSGRDLESLALGCLCIYYPGDGVAVATQRLQAEGLFPEIAVDRVSDYFLLGSADDLYAGITRYVDAGARHLVIACPAGSTSDLDEFLANVGDVVDRVRSEAERGVASATKGSSRP